LTLVVDASIAIKWLVAEPGHEVAAALLLDFPETSAPDFGLVDVGNALWKKVRRAEMRAGRVEQALASLPQFFDVLLPARRFVGRVLQISLELDHPIYDCLYLACAEENAAKLTTVDARLMRRYANTPFAERVLFVDRAIDPASLN
jgi:predicted nucleic acid-binding protein